MAKEKIVQDRLEKLAALRAAGADPYGGRVETSGCIAEVRDRCPQEETAEAEAPRVTVAGRVVALRDMGKSKWLDLQDRSGRIQANLLKKRVGEDFELARHLDIGDFLAVTGALMRSRKGEITVFADSFRFLCKSLEPLPAKWEGLRDVEIRFRRRYLDLAANPDSRARFVTRSRIVAWVRAFMDARGIMEEEAPL